MLEVFAQVPPLQWSKIHRAKGVEDQKKSQRFSKAVTVSPISLAQHSSLTTVAARLLQEIIAAARSKPVHPTLPLPARLTAPYSLAQQKGARTLQRTPL